MTEGFYETPKALSEYLLFHYGKPDEVLPWDCGPTDALDYPVRCVTECVDANRLPAEARALDLGCGNSLALERLLASRFGSPHLLDAHKKELATKVMREKKEKRCEAGKLTDSRRAAARYR